jgi:uncharacterized protein
MPELVLQVHDIDDRGTDYDFELTPVWLDAALADSSLRRDPSTGSGALHVHAQRNGREILVTGDVDATLLVPCARCLGDAKLPVHAALTALLVPGTKADLATHPEETELEEDDLDRAYYEGHEVVLDDLVREHLLLEAPMQPLCSADCKGIEIPERLRPPADDFGDGKTDPRLRPLEKLRARLSGDKE